MSVQTQIDRLEAAKEAISTAIAGKGVTVPDGTMLDGMAALIESIVAGGNDTKIALGSITTTTSSSAPIIEHGLGVMPNILIWVARHPTGMMGRSTYLYVYDGAGVYYLYYNGSSFLQNASTSSNYLPTYTGNGGYYLITDLTEQSFSPPLVVLKGTTYYWVVAKI